MPILPTHKQGIVYLEHCKVVVNDEKLSFIKRKDALEKYWSIPYANINVLLLGCGTSLSQQAARILAEENVMVAFAGGGGTPVFLASQNEYRPTEYLQAWFKIWSTPELRLKTAKFLQRKRAEKVFQAWQQLLSDQIDYEKIIAIYINDIIKAQDNPQLMAYEAKFTKQLYACLAKSVNQLEFRRDNTADDSFNQFLNNGNYLAYGLGAAALWSLGLSFSLPVSHGQTRRGGLVFDIADLIKDACIMPIAFQQAAAGKTAREMRKACVAWLDKQQALEYLFKTIIAATREYAC